LPREILQSYEVSPEAAVCKNVLAIAGVASGLGRAMTEGLLRRARDFSERLDTDKK
jgi:hypothetical protein